MKVNLTNRNNIVIIVLGQINSLEQLNTYMK